MREPKSDSLARLSVAIVQLEEQQAEEARILKEDIRGISGSIKPANLLKSALGAISESKSNLLTTSVGLSLGILSKALFEGATAGPIKKVLGTLLFFGISQAVSPININSIGEVFGRLIGRFPSKLDEVSSS